MKLCVKLSLLALLLAFPLPAPAQVPPNPSAAVSDFPSLPPSKPCTKNDILGLWQLVDVHEAPAGRELADFRAFPHQYLLFNANDTYGRINTQIVEKPEDIIRSIEGQTPPVLRQFVVDKAGFVFFYQNRVATDTQACFIVANRSGKFWPGQMLIMPPKGQHVGRLVSVYGKHWMPNERPQPQKPSHLHPLRNR